MGFLVVVKFSHKGQQQKCWVDDFVYRFIGFFDQLPRLIFPKLLKLLSPHFRAEWGFFI